MLDYTKRTQGSGAISGTNTFLNTPPSANTTLDDYVDYGYAGGPSRQLGELMSTFSGPFC